MIVVTGATGHLGRYVVEELIKKVPPSSVVAAVRAPEKAADLAARGVVVRRADYDVPATVVDALSGASQVLLISANVVGRRLPQHLAVIEAAKKVGVRQLAYTSILRADTSKLKLAEEHRATEEAITASGIPFVFLRNGWYFENYTEALSSALARGAIVGSAGQGRIAAASRLDYALAAVEALTKRHENRIHELGGDASFSMSELASEVTRQSGKAVVYRDLSPAEHREVLVGAGLPPVVAEILVDADQGIQKGELDHPGDGLRRLIGRPTTSLTDAVAEGLARISA